MSVVDEEGLVEEASTGVSTSTTISTTAANGSTQLLLTLSPPALHLTSTTTSTSTSTHQTKETIMRTVVGVGVETLSGFNGNAELHQSGGSNTQTTVPMQYLDVPYDLPADDGNLLRTDGRKWSGCQQKDQNAILTNLLDTEVKNRELLVNSLLISDSSAVPAFPTFHDANVNSQAISSLDDLKSELAASSVKMSQLENDLRESRSLLTTKDSRLQEVLRQLDAHRQEHARQAATISSMRQRLQEEADLNSQLKGQQRRTELTLTALTRENRLNHDRIMELENRLRTHMDEREIAEQRNDCAQKRLQEVFSLIKASLKLSHDISAENGLEKLATQINQLVQERDHFKENVVALTEAKSKLEEATSHTSITLNRLVTELDDHKQLNDEYRKQVEQWQKDVDTAKTKNRTLEEEVKSVRDRLHHINKQYSDTLEELHITEKKYQQSKDELLVAQHKHQQAEAEWRGFLCTLSALLSSPGDRVPVETQMLTEKVQSTFNSAREYKEISERQSLQLTAMTDQIRNTKELYEASVVRGRKTEAEVESLSSRVKQLEIELATSESAFEKMSTQRDKAVSIMGRVVDALGLKELGEEISHDAELVVCRAQQLAKMEGEKIVDKTTTVYQLQRRLKGLREAVDRKDMHIDMLRRKMAMMETDSRGTIHLREERDEIFARCRKQERIIERLSSELSDFRKQTRELKEQLSESSDVKVKSNKLGSQVEELSNKVDELDAIRSRQQKKINQLKEQIKVYEDHSVESRRIHESTMEGLGQELAATKHACRELSKREKQLSDFRRNVLNVIGAEDEEELGSVGEMECLSRLEKILSTHKELTDISKRLDDLSISSRPNSARPMSGRPINSQCSSRPTSPYRSSKTPLYSQRLSVTPFTSSDIPEDIRLLLNNVDKRNPNLLSRRPSSARSRTPSPTKNGIISDDE